MALLFGFFVFSNLAFAFIKPIRAMAATVLAAKATAQKVLFCKNNITFLAGVIIAGQKL